MAILTICCLWIVTDVAYGVRMWELGVDAWIGRIKALAIILIGVSLSYLFFNYLANTFLDRNKERRSRPVFREYLWVVLFNLVVLNIGLYIVIYSINGTTYRWGEALMINAVAVPIFLLYYFLIRNNILAKRYSEKIVQLEKLRVDQLETQLKLLKMQYHPHFLFNALNTIYFLIDEENEEAIEAVELLSDLLRYQLYDINTKVTIEEEIDYLRTYIQFQRLLENAFKYIGGAYRIQVSMRKEGAKVCLGVSNTFNPDFLEQRKGKGIGIDNLRKRLELLYPDKHELRIKKDNTRFRVELCIDLSE